jgi:cytochrome P450
VLNPRYVDGFLNQIVYQLYARAGRSAAPPDPDGTMKVVDNPKDADLVLKSPEHFRKNYSLLSALGRSRFNADGPEWRARRDLTQPTYLEAGKTQNRSTVYATYEDWLSKCRDVAPEAIQASLMAASATIFHRAFGCEVDVEPTLRFFDQARSVVKTLQYFSWNRPAPAEVLQLTEQARSVLQAYSTEVNRSPAFLRVLEHVRGEAAAILDFSPGEEFMMNFFAGVETTAATLCWAVDRLGADQQAQSRLYDEVSQDGEHFPLLECFINETMRYFPPIPFIIREVVSRQRLNDQELFPGTLLLVSVVGVHHHQDYWDEPHIFDSRRPAFLQNTYDRTAFIPFLAGPRMCGGSRLARLELTEGLKCFIRMYSAKRTTDEVFFDYGLALRPVLPNNLQVSRRNG